MSSCDEKILEDIEDITAEGRINPGKVVPKVFMRNHAKKTKVSKNATKPTYLPDEISANLDKSEIIQSGIPGVQTVYVKTWGCSHNSSDSEYMAGQLAAYGYKVTDNDGENADVWLLNSCTVKNPAEDHFRNMIEAGKRKGKPVVIAGCVPQAAPRKDYMQGLSLIGVQQIDRVVEVVEETLKGNHVRLLGKKKVNGKKTGGSSLDLPKIRRNPLIEIISINTGCLNACTYCKTKHARGDLGSYTIEEIVNRAKQSFEEGVVEIWLTSEDTGAYGKDIGVTLPELLWKLVEVIPEGCMLRIGMTNPPYILEHIEEIGKILNSPRVYAFMHIPVQAGSDVTLNEMRREYTVADFEYVVDSLRKNVPGISIATDIICGFPTETKEDFADTIKLCKKYKFPSLFINQFFPRPGTPAAKLPQIDRQEIKKRTKELSEFFKSYEPYTEQLGKTFTILVTEISHDKAHYVGHNKYYQQVLVEMDENLMGKMFDVEIYETGKFFLKGRKLDKSHPKSPGVAERAQLGEVTGAIISSNITTKYLTKDKSNYVMVLVVLVAFLISYLAKKL